MSTNDFNSSKMFNCTLLLFSLEFKRPTFFKFKPHSFCFVSFLVFVFFFNFYFSLMFIIIIILNSKSNISSSIVAVFAPHDVIVSVIHTSRTSCNCARTFCRTYIYSMLRRREVPSTKGLVCVCMCVCVRSRNYRNKQKQQLKRRRRRRKRKQQR